MQKQTLKDMVVSCGRDPTYFIKNYVRIKHPVRGLIPFALFDYQERLLDDYLNNRFNIILKARQLGISEVTAAYAAWLMLFHKDQNILVMATKAETAKNLIRKVKTALSKIPKWLMLSDITVDNRMSIELSNGSVIKATASSDDAGRSEALSLLIVDEAAFIKNFEELWTGLLPTVQAGGRVIVLSTPNGVGNVFHKLYTEAVNAQNEFKSTMIMWWEHPERRDGLIDDPDRPGFKTSPWFRKETKNMSPREIAQELECNFNASGETVIGGENLVWIERDCITPPVWIEGEERRLHVWKRRNPEKRYFISADVARGDGRDYSAMHVWEIGDPLEQVAEFYAQVPPDQFAEVLCRTGREYGECMLVVENNNVGLACLEHVKLKLYPNVYYSRKGDIRPGEAVNAAYASSNSDLVIGFTTSQKTRPLIISKLEEYVRGRAVNFRSRRTLGEFRTFIWNGGHAEAMRGYNDDLVMAAAIGIWVKDTFIAPGFTSIELQKRLLSNISMNRIVNTDIRGASKDPRLVPRQTMGPYVSPPSPYQIRLPRGGFVDFRDLLGPLTKRK